MEQTAQEPIYTTVDFQHERKQKPGFLSIFLSLLILLILTASLAFGAGYLLGRYKTNQPLVGNVVVSHMTV